MNREEFKEEVIKIVEPHCKYFVCFEKTVNGNEFLNIDGRDAGIDCIGDKAGLYISNPNKADLYSYGDTLKYIKKRYK